jgi:hypothetical protein
MIYRSTHDIEEIMNDTWVFRNDAWVFRIGDHICDHRYIYVVTGMFSDHATNRHIYELDGDIYMDANDVEHRFGFAY